MILVFMVNFDQQTTHPYVLQNLFNFLPELRLHVPLNFSILIFQIYGSNLEVPTLFILF